MSDGGVTIQGIPLPRKRDVNELHVDMWQQELRL